MEDASLNILQRISLWIVPVYLAIVLHELAHGCVARMLGDATASDVGRLTLNPARHLDPVGSIAVPAVLLLLVNFVFGWAKPVPVDANRLRYPRRDMVLVAAAGPAANLLMSIAWAFVLKAGLWMLVTVPNAALVLIYTGAAGVVINAAILMFNLVPLLPLDGGRILACLLPERLGALYRRLEPWGFPLLILIVLAGIAGQVLWSLMLPAVSSVLWLSSVPPEVLIAALRVLLGQV